MARPMNCSVCLIATTHPDLYSKMVEAKATKRQGIVGAHRIALAVDPSITRHRIEAHFGARTGLNACADPYLANSGTGIATARLELTATGHGRIETGEIEGDMPPAWNDLIATLGGDPETTCVKNDTIRVSAREVVKKDANGEPYRTIVRSYGASLVPRDLSMEGLQHRVELAVEVIRSGLRAGVRPISRKQGRPRNKNASFVIAWGDTQLGKSAAGGHEATVDRFVDAISRAVDHYEDRVALGYRYNEIFMPVLGDLTEGVAGNYDSQLFQSTLNKADQDTLALEVVAWAIEFVRARTQLPLRVLFVNSNHGEHSRLSLGSGKNKTSASDTVDRVIAKTLDLVYRNDKAVEILCPAGNLVMTAKLNGVPCAFAHGHGIGARAKATTIQQELLAYDTELTELNGGVPFLPKLWVTAHYHSLQIQDVGPYVWVQTPALEGAKASSWFTNQSGKYSRPGLVTMTVGDEFVEDGGIADVTPIFVHDRPRTKRTDWHNKLVEAYNHYAANYTQ